ncbi:nicotinate (nicotinamide) nucleotide adenylyltransferase [Gloeobacter kilaueensis]|uniref:Probable nicotinate-nucleotide adenylyltransferase n=1 Tax=Gloeobacter kilaueensis (strain ATCC BAA-2537 / CCAP 1431/1 / ULC 316 / JS1) TaxID=1183438 RepID=U5QRF8_GLOK1|nr:nicotinate (nicotinamide) nucleotide adenylyltransferase [Gloeobacter kilaueensis]AGY60234.1 nicotinate (nicotinamide) nucleotide adenylyltransferase [Gloeobacter kilaueensis JS1]
MGGKLCIFGGTFNPVHRGHLAMARAACKQFDLDRLLWVPAGQPPHKPLLGNATIDDRLEMVRLAIASEAGMELSPIDAHRPGPAYAIDTLELLDRAYPETCWYWLLGEDSLIDLPGWQRASELIGRCHWLVAARQNNSRLEGQLVELRERYRAQFSPLAHFWCAISSTGVRERIAQGLAIDDLVPGAVAAYIHRHHLYTAHPR